MKNTLKQQHLNNIDIFSKKLLKSYLFLLAYKYLIHSLITKKKVNVFNLIISLHNKKESFLLSFKKKIAFYMELSFQKSERIKTEYINRKNYMFYISCSNRYSVFLNLYLNKLLFLSKWSVSNNTMNHSNISNLLKLLFISSYIKYKKIFTSLFVNILFDNKSTKNVYINSYYSYYYRLVNSYYINIQKLHRKNTSLFNINTNKVVLFDVSEFVGNKTERFNLIYNPDFLYLYFLKCFINFKHFCSINFKHFCFFYFFTMLLYSWEFHSRYYRLFLDDEFKLFNVYKKYVLTFHLN